MVNSVKNRLSEFISDKKLSVNALSAYIGIPQTTLNQAMKSDRKISVDVIALILERFPELSAEWLLRGEGEMIRQKNDEKTINITNVHRSVTGDNITGSMVSKQDQEELNRLRQQLTNKEEQLAEKDARIKELTDTIIKMALK